MKRISVECLRTDLNADMSDQDMMRKYDLSEEALRTVFFELIQAVMHGRSHIEIHNHIGKTGRSGSSPRNGER
jgi:uncharacterized protein (DUF433 family)